QVKPETSNQRPETNKQLRELFKESKVVLKQQSNVIDVVHQTGHPIDSQPECEPREFLRIDADLFQYVWMNHSASAQFNPTRTLAHSASGASADITTEVDFRRRLGEWKIRRAKPGSHARPKHHLDEPLQCSFQIGKRDVAIDVQAFDLEEHWIVSRVGCVASEHAARRNHSQRRLLTLHRVYLNSRCLTPKSEVFRNIKRIGGIARRVAGRNIERVEVVKAGFDLGSIFNRITHRHKHVLDFLPNERERMKMPVSGPRAGQRDIDLFALESFGLRFGGKLFAEARDLGLDFRADFIDLAPEFSACFGSQ